MIDDDEALVVYTLTILGTRREALALVKALGMWVLVLIVTAPIWLWLVVLARVAWLAVTLDPMLALAIVGAFALLVMLSSVPRRGAWGPYRRGSR